MAGGLGAIFGPIAAMSGLAANSRASGQRQAQLDTIEQLKAQGLLQDQQAKQFDLQDAIEQHAARAKLMNDPNLPQEVKDALAAGASPADAMKMRSQGSAAKVVAQLLNAKPEERQKILADALAADPSLESQLSEFLKIPGVGAKTTKDSDFDTFYQSLPKGTPLLQARSMWMAAGREPKSDTGTETPISPADIVNKDGKTGVWMKSKGGAPSFVEMPGANPKTSAGRKPLTPMALNAVAKQIDNEWALQPMSAGDLVSGDRKREFYSQRKKVILFGMGYNESGQPFKNGESVTDPTSGKTLTWRDS